MTAGTVARDLAATGYATLPGLITEDRCAAVRRSLGRGRTGRRMRVGRVQDAWRTTPEVRDLACEPAVLQLLAELYGRRPIPFQTLNFARGTEQPLHQDLLHFDSIPTGLMCGVWVALEDVGESQGPLVVVPGSHRLTPPDPTKFRDGTGRFDMRAYEAAIANRVGVAGQELQLSAGDAVLWAAGLVHGGAPQTDASVSRWSQVTHYFFERAAYVTPIHSEPGPQGRVLLRDPLFDISARRFVEHCDEAGPVRSLRSPGGGRRLLAESEPDPSRFQTMASNSLHRTLTFRTSAALAMGRVVARARATGTSRVVDLDPIVKQE